MRIAFIIFIISMTAIAESRKPSSKSEKWECDNSVHPHPNEGLKELPGTGGCPAGMVRIAATKNVKPASFCMDQFEASLELIEDDSITDWSPFHNPAKKKVRAVSLPGAMPQQFISGDQAKLACERAGKRLCKDSEWLRACRGPNEGDFPYSWPANKNDRKTARNRYPNGSSKANPNCHESVPAWAPGLYCKLAPHPDCTRNADGPANRIFEPCVAQIPNNQASPTGSFLNCVTPEGVFDLVGNVHEWTANREGTFRGGYFSDTKINGEGCNYATTAHTTPHWDYSTGFRCCADAPVE